MLRKQRKAGAKSGRGRVLFLDMIRGMAVLHMVAYHLLYDLVYIFGVQVGWFGIQKSFVWEQFICFTFILVAGISFHLSRRPWKNGLKLLGCALLLSAVTITVIPSEGIWFGILHFLAGAILLTCLIRPVLERIPAAAGVTGSLLLFIITRNIPGKRLSLFNWWEWKLPEELFQTPFLFWAGFPDSRFTSADYFPLIPWVFLFLTGYFAGPWWIKGSDTLKERTALAENTAYCLADRILGTVGRKALWIYMLHQPMMYGILLIIYQ